MSKKNPIITSVVCPPDDHANTENDIPVHLFDLPLELQVLIKVALEIDHRCHAECCTNLHDKTRQLVNAADVVREMMTR